MSRQTISDEEFDRLNHKAYMDVLDAENPDPSLKDNQTYTECYASWKNLVGEEHFDPHYEYWYIKGVNMFL